MYLLARNEVKDKDKMKFSCLADRKLFGRDNGYIESHGTPIAHLYSKQVCGSGRIRLATKMDRAGTLHVNVPFFLSPHTYSQTRRLPNLQPKHIAKTKFNGTHFRCQLSCCARLHFPWTFAVVRPYFVVWQKVSKYYQQNALFTLCPIPCQRNM